jgi:hypothetical protein
MGFIVAGEPHLYRLGAGRVPPAAPSLACARVASFKSTTAVGVTDSKDTSRRAVSFTQSSPS